MCELRRGSREEGIRGRGSGARTDPGRYRRVLPERQEGRRGRGHGGGVAGAGALPGVPGHERAREGRRKGEKAGGGDICSLCPAASRSATPALKPRRSRGPSSQIRILYNGVQGPAGRGSLFPALLYPFLSPRASQPATLVHVPLPPGNPSHLPVETELQSRAKSPSPEASPTAEIRLRSPLL